MTYRLKVRLNGTAENPFHRWGLKQNPFLQIGRAEWDVAERKINSLGGDPIPDTDYIRRVLQGFSDEFVELCCAQFVKGEMKEFVVTFGEEEPS